jgi:hypothetical protein
MNGHYLKSVIKVPHERFRYRVRSSKPGVTYFVDLLENDGFGRCDCLDFETRRWPRKRKGESSRPCKHIIRCQLVAWRFIAEQIRIEQKRNAKGHHVA